MQSFHFISEGVSGGDYLHAGDGGQTPVHGVGGYSGRIQAVDITHWWQTGQLRPATEQHHIAPFFFGQQLPRLGDELVNQASGLFSGGLYWSDR